MFILKLMLRLLSLIFVFLHISIYAQEYYWQQEIKYDIKVELDDKTHIYQGYQDIAYRNNSPDTLKRLFFHLYYNAFRPGSMMDVRSRSIEDPDPRIGDRISQLKEDEAGYLRVNSFKIKGESQEIFEHGTILEVKLSKPILPGKQAKIELDFEGRVPVQIRRSGRDSKEGVAYSMSQWYPKLSEYDELGWHADSYVEREFHGVWGEFNVSITLDSAYTIGGTGVLQNPEEIGHGYEVKKGKLKRPDSNKLTWEFKAENVHDFMWAADKDYIHTWRDVDGTRLHFFYKDEDGLKANWERLPDYTERALKYANKTYGQYPWPQYSVIQGGDGGMEYPMATLITGRRKFGSLVGVTVHELVHSWYQSILANNEGLYSWLDEGFCQYGSARIMSYLFKPDEDMRRPSYYDSYLNLTASGKEEPMSTMADHFKTNYAYSAATYSKGAVFLAQIGYIIGEEELLKALKRYYETWEFKHPTPERFIQTVQLSSGIHLKWYLKYFLNTTETIDYGIKTVGERQGSAYVALEKIGHMPMPIDLVVTYADGEVEHYNIPLRMMHGSKTYDTGVNYVVAEDWPWTSKNYELSLKRPLDQVLKVEIDPTRRMADVNPANNVIDLQEKMQLESPN
jgi:hypothetical protein